MANWFQRKSHFKRKTIINKKYCNVRTSVSIWSGYLFRVLDRRVFKFCPRNQPEKKGYHFPLVHNMHNTERKRTASYVNTVLGTLLQVVFFQWTFTWMSTRFQKHAIRDMTRKVKWKHLLQLMLCKGPIEEVWYNCKAHCSAHLFIIEISSHSHIKRKHPQWIFLQCSCTVGMINVVKKYMCRAIDELNTLIGCSDDS